MDTQPLRGKKIAVLMETEYIPEEIATYQRRFTELGADVHFMSRLWGQKSVTFVSDADALGKAVESFEVNIDFDDVNVNDYAAVLMAANYTSVRLRYFESPSGVVDPANARKAPAVAFYAKAMANPAIIKGALCHGLWIMTPRPELLKGRRVICHEVVLADILNAGAIYTYSETGVVVDHDLVTGRSKNEAALYSDTIAKRIMAIDVEQRAGKKRR